VSTFDATLAVLCVLGTALAVLAWISRPPRTEGDRGNDSGLAPIEGGQATSEAKKPSNDDDTNKDQFSPNVTTGRDISGEERKRDSEYVQRALESAKAKFRKDAESSD
jgi:hypothetical protein